MSFAGRGARREKRAHCTRLKLREGATNARRAPRNAQPMAYRHAAPARGSSHGAAPSYLEDFLEEIQGLPVGLKQRLTELRHLDDSAGVAMSDAEAVVARGVAGGMEGGDIKSVMQDLLKSQRAVVDAGERKKELAEEAYGVVEGVLESLDIKLKEFEARLRKEGRWPAAGDSRGRPGGTDSRVPASKVVAAVQEAAVAEVSSSKPPVAPGVAGGIVKSRKKDSAAGADGGPAVKGQKAARERKREREKEKAAAAAPLPAPVSVGVLEDMAIDPAEQKYCFCNQVSFGDMVACENEKCVYEWFHFQCVGLTQEPTGQWRCPECKKSANRRKLK